MDWTARSALTAALAVALAVGVEKADSADKSAEPEKPRIAVADFKVVGDVGIKDAGQAVAELLLTSFDTKKYRLVERTHLVAILKEQDLTMKLGKLGRCASNWRKVVDERAIR